MKLRVFLRGLGIALIVIPLIYTIAPDAAGRPMTDEQIKARAAALGMVEEEKQLISFERQTEEPEKEEALPEEPEKAEVASETEEPVKTEEAAEPSEPDKTEEPVKTEETDEAVKPEEPSEPAKTETPETEAEPEAAAASQEEPKTEEPVEDTQTAKAAGGSTGGTYSLSIAGGSSSDQVARLLEKGGLVDSAASFDSYLCANRYDGKIVAGTHSIPAGADYKTIAEIITSR